MFLIELNCVLLVVFYDLELSKVIFSSTFIFPPCVGLTPSWIAASNSAANTLVQSFNLELVDHHRKRQQKRLSNKQFLSDSFENRKEVSSDDGLTPSRSASLNSFANCFVHVSKLEGSTTAAAYDYNSLSDGQFAPKFDETRECALQCLLKIFQ